MKRFALIVASTTLLLTLTGERVEAEEKTRKIAVLALKLETALDQGIANTLNEIMLNEFQQIGKLQVLSASDISTILQLEEKRMMLGCNDDSCLAELGGALGVPLLAMPGIGAVGDQYVINLKVIDVPNAVVLARSSEIVPKNDSELIRAVKESVANVVSALGLKKKVPVVPPGLKSTPKRVAPWLMLGLTVAAGGSAAIMAGLSKKDSDSANALFEGTSRWIELRDSSKGKAIAADVLFGVAGAAAVTTVILFIVGRDRAETPTTAMSFIPTDSGAMASFSTRF